MSSATSTSARFKVKRSALILSAGVFAAALTLGGTVAANAVTTATVSLSASTATANGQLTLTAAGFAANEPLTVTIDSSPLTTYTSSPYTQDVADGSGNYVTTAYLPSSLSVGAHTITVTGATTGPASAPIAITTSPVGSVTPSTVTLAAYLSKGVTVTFTGFTVGDSVSFGMGDQGSGGPVGAPVVVGASGTATLDYMPTAGASYSTAGTYTFSASAADGSIVGTYTTLTVTPNAVVAPAPVAAPAAPIKHAASFTG